MQLEIVLVFPRCMLQLIVMSPCISLICKVDEKWQSLNRLKSDFNMLFMTRTSRHSKLHPKGHLSPKS